MHPDVIQYHGSYRYADRATLEGALARARATLDDDEVERANRWLRCFVMNGTNLTVNLSVPADADQRHAAANVFLTLAHGAMEGAVEARHGNRPLDLFAPGDDD